MASQQDFIVSNCLCYLTNKYNKSAAKPLKVLLTEFYSPEALAEAKELILRVIDSMKKDNVPHIARNRRASNSKPLLDIEDIFTAFAYLDEHNLRKDIPTFVASSPDGMPSIRLLDGDFNIIWTKLT